MITFFWLIIGTACSGAGMLYSHKNKSHKRWAVVLFAIAAVGSIILGIKAAADSSTTAATTTSTAFSNNAPVIQGVTIMSTNQSGGFNGVNTGTVNLAPPSPAWRKLTEDQITDIKAAIKPMLGDSEIVVDSVMGDEESMALAQQISDLIGLPGINRSIWRKHAEGIEIQVRDENPPPPIADALFTHLIKAKLKAGMTQHPDWPDSDNDKVVINVFSNTNHNP